MGNVGCGQVLEMQILCSLPGEMLMPPCELVGNRGIEWGAVSRGRWHAGGMLFAFSVAPSGGDAPDASVHDAVADAVKIVRESGLPNRTDAMFTTIEGDWDECMDVIKRASEAVGKYGTRVSLVLKADIRPGYDGELTGKLERLEKAIESEA